MIDKRVVANRFILCFTGMKYNELARLLHVHQSSVSKWIKYGNVPWNKVKYLSDAKSVSWDWLIDGIEPQYSSKEPHEPESTYPDFDFEAINSRFLSLFEGMTQVDIARAFEITPQAVHEWVRAVRGISWKYLDFAVNHSMSAGTGFLTGWNRSSVNFR